MPQTDETSDTVKTADTVFDIIGILDRSDGVGVTDVARELDMSKSTVYKHLKTLHRKEYVVKDGDDYRLSLRFLKHGMSVRSNLVEMDPVQDVLDNLAEETGEAVWLVVEEHGKAVNIAKAMHERSVQTLEHIGMRTDMHYHAAGKAILAQMPESRVREIFNQEELPMVTEKTITSRTELFEELEAIRDRGYAFMDGEAIKGISSVAAPVMIDNAVFGSITVVGPSNRMQNERSREEIPEDVISSTNVLELELTYE